MNIKLPIPKNFKYKPILKALAIGLPLTIMLLVVGIYLFKLIDDSLREHYSINKDNGVNKYYMLAEDGFYQPYVEDGVDLTLLDPMDISYFENADYFIKDEWKPEEYIEIPRTVDLPGYEIEAGSVVEDEWDIGEGDTLKLECDEIDEKSLGSPPYSPRCTLIMNCFVMKEDVQSDVYCQDYGDGTNPTRCSQTIGLVIYDDPKLEKKYIFVDTGTVDIDHNIYVYGVRDRRLSEVKFDHGEELTEFVLTRDSMDFTFAFTDESKSNVKLITHFYDSSMSSIDAIYSEWDLEEYKFLLNKKVVSLREE